MPDDIKPYQLTESDKVLIRGMGHQGRFGGVTNIAAIHFDGQILVDIIYMKQEADRRAIASRYLDK